MTLLWTVDNGEHGAKVALSGHISEKVDFAALSTAIPAGAIVFDLGGVQRINSSGIREWIRFLEGLAARGDQLALERCSVPIVHQLVMIHRFRGAATVRSVLAPYFCDACNREQTRVIDLAGDVAAQITGHETCSQCGGVMELDDVPDHYLKLRTS